MALDPTLLELLACPEDHGPLACLESESVLYNPRLRRTYEIRDDIPILLIEEATSVDEARHQILVAAAAAAGIPLDLDL